MRDVNVEIQRAVDRLDAQRKTMIDYLQLRLSVDDMHGVQDAGSEIREIDAKTETLYELREALYEPAREGEFK
jgi:hypothetical protein